MGCGICHNRHSEIDPALKKNSSQTQQQQQSQQQQQQQQQQQGPLNHSDSNQMQQQTNTPRSKSSHGSNKKNSAIDLQRSNYKNQKLSALPNRTLTTQQEKDIIKSRNSLQEDQKTKTLIFQHQQQSHHQQQPISDIKSPCVYNGQRPDNRQNSNRSSNISDAFTFDPYKGVVGGDQKTNGMFQKKSNFHQSNENLDNNKRNINSSNNDNSFNNRHKLSIDQTPSELNSPTTNNNEIGGGILQKKLSPLHRKSNPSILNNQLAQQLQQQQQKWSITDVQQFGQSANFGYRHSIKSLEGMEMIGQQQITNSNSADPESDSFQQQQMQLLQQTIQMQSDFQMKRNQEKQLSVVHENNNELDRPENYANNGGNLDQQQHQLQQQNYANYPSQLSNRQPSQQKQSLLKSGGQSVNYKQYFKTNLLDLLKEQKQLQQQQQQQPQFVANATSTNANNNLDQLSTNNQQQLQQLQNQQTSSNVFNNSNNNEQKLQPQQQQQQQPQNNRRQSAAQVSHIETGVFQRQMSSNRPDKESSLSSPFTPMTNQLSESRGLNYNNNNGIINNNNNNNASSSNNNNNGINNNNNNNNKNGISSFRKASRRVSNFQIYCDMQDVNIAKQNPKINLVEYVKFKKQQKLQQEICQDDYNNGQDSMFFPFQDVPSPINRGLKKCTITSIPRRYSRFTNNEDFSNVFQPMTTSTGINGLNFQYPNSNNSNTGGNTQGYYYNQQDENQSKSQSILESQDMISRNEISKYDFFIEDNVENTSPLYNINVQNYSNNSNNINNNLNDLACNSSAGKRTYLQDQQSQSKISFSQRTSLVSVGNQSNMELNQGMRCSASTISDNNIKQLCLQQYSQNNNSVNNQSRKQQQSNSDNTSQNRSSNNVTALQLLQGYQSQQQNNQNLLKEQPYAAVMYHELPYYNNNNNNNNNQPTNSYESDQTSFQSQLCSPNKQVQQETAGVLQRQTSNFSVNNQILQPMHGFQHDTDYSYDDQSNYLSVKLANTAATATGNTQNSASNNASKNQPGLFNILEDNSSMDFENSRITNKLSQKQDSLKQIQQLQQQQQQQKKSEFSEQKNQEQEQEKEKEKEEGKQSQNIKKSQKQTQFYETSKEVTEQQQSLPLQQQAIRKSLTTVLTNYNSKIQLCPEPQNQIRPQKKSMDERQNALSARLDDDGNSLIDPEQSAQYLRRVKSVNYSKLQESHSFIYTEKLDKSTDASGQKKINQYVLMNKLGRGSFGKVKLVLDVKQNKYFAAKIINKMKLKKKMLSKTRSAYSLVEQEIAILKKLAHPNICQLFEVIDDPDQEKLLLIMEYVKKGSINSKQYWRQQLDKAFDEQKFEDKEYQISIDKIKKYFKDFLLGLDYLHNYANVVHRDIKPDNLLIDSTDCLKIADFGVSKIFEDENDELQNDTGTKYFLAPEIWLAKPFKGRPADIWATGVTLYMLVTGQPPFQSKSVEALKKLVLESEPEYPDTLDPNLKHFIQQCLQKNPNLRLNVEQLMIHPWITDNGRCPLQITKWDGICQVSDKEICKAFTKMTIKTTVFVKKQLKQVLERSRSKIMHKKSMDVN